MKKILIIILSLVLLFALVACGQREEVKYGPEHDEQIIGGVQTPNPFIELNSYEEALVKNALTPDLSEYGCTVLNYQYAESIDTLDIKFIKGDFKYGGENQAYDLRIAKDDGISSVRELSGCHYNFVDLNGIYFMMDHVFQRMDAKNGDKNIYLHWFEKDGYYFILTTELNGDFESPFNK